ncbi:hypothetical protein HK405_013942, partial [Cladochytrium tenue]
LVKTKAKEQQPDRQSVNDATWKCCALSKEPLRSPVVACRLGRLYNKDKLIEFLLNRRAFGDGHVVAGHVLSMKDVVTLKLTPNPAYNDKDSRSSAIVSNFSDKVQPARWICPVSLKEMNGTNRFCFLATCGCVLSDAALRQVPTSTCLQCGTAFDPARDVVPLNPTAPEEIDRLRTINAALQAERAAADDARRAARLAKKAAAAVAVTADSASTTAAAAADGNVVTAPRRKRVAPSGAEAGVEAIQGPAAARRRTSPPPVSVVGGRGSINVPLPAALKDLGRAGKDVIAQSEAIKSLYARPGAQGGAQQQRGNYLTMGTFTRYAAY